MGREMKTHNAIVCVALFFCMSCVNASWEGSYFCEVDLDKTVADQPGIVEYDLALGDKKCLITIAGYQMAEEIKCETKPAKHGVSIHFVSCANGKLKNAYGVEQYKPGEKLFQFEMRDKNIETHWGSLWPGESIEKAGVYFVKEL